MLEAGMITSPRLGYHFLFCFFPPILPEAEGMIDGFKRSPSSFEVMKSSSMEFI
jgi:hypothetical protein